MDRLKEVLELGDKGANVVVMLPGGLLKLAVVVDKSGAAKEQELQILLGSVGFHCS